MIDDGEIGDHLMGASEAMDRVCGALHTALGVAVLTDDRDLAVIRQLAVDAEDLSERIVDVMMPGTIAKTDAKADADAPIAQ